MNNTKLASPLLAVWFLLAVVNTVWANTTTVPLVELEPQYNHTQTTKWVSRLLANYHYKKVPLDDTLSVKILEQYINLLDPGRSYFIQPDITQFYKHYQYVLDEAIKDTDLSPAFTIFKHYRTQVIGRIDHALKLLKKDFDFTKDEDFAFDRQDSAWASDMDQLNELWRKRVKNDVLNLRLTKKAENEINTILSKRYTHIKKRIQQFNANDVFQYFINAYTTSIEPHTSYFSPRTYENFDISMRLSLEGIGAVLRSEGEYTQIVKIVPGGPADLSKQLKAEDRIIGVGQGNDEEIIDIIGWRLDDVVQRIRGPKDSTLRLEILSKESAYSPPAKIITLVRNKIKLEEQAASSSLIETDRGKIGVITIPTFYIDFTAKNSGKRNYKSTTRDVAKLITELHQQGIDGLVIDLRNNGGGALAEALKLTGLFIDEGPIVLTRNASSRIETSLDPIPGVHYAGPLAVLVDRNSASASEIFAGAIQDYRRGIVVGEPTFGKGTVQHILDLNRYAKKAKNEYGRLKITIAQFYRISGHSNQYKGVIPDIIFPTMQNTAKQGERAYKNAIAWDQIKASHYTPFYPPLPDVSSVARRHKARIKEDELFRLFLMDMALTHQHNERKIISLAEKKRKMEREEFIQHKTQIYNKMRAVQGLPPLPKELDVSNANELAEDDGFEQIDVLLNETAHILSDIIASNGDLAIELNTAIR